ncbi:hypothetical protein LXL04_002988 [Taraxacum kok-saghyz]
MVPIKVNVFAWKMICDDLPTRWNLSQRGLELNCMLCPICGEKVEDMEHLFFTCSFASEITDKVVRWWGFSTYSFPSLQSWKGWLDGVRLRKKLKEVLEGGLNYLEALNFSGGGGGLRAKVGRCGESLLAAKLRWRATADNNTVLAVELLRAASFSGNPLRAANVEAG